MAPTIPIGEPNTATAGDTWEWTRSFPDYLPAEGAGTWTLSYVIVGAGEVAWQSGWAVADAAGWTVTIPATATAGLAPGRYSWTAILTGGGTLAGRRATPASGVLTVISNPAVASEGDGQTFAEKNLAAVEAVLEGRLTADIQGYSIDGVAVTAIPFTELLNLRNRLRNEVWRERNRGKAFPAVQLAFRQPGSSVA